MSLWCITIKIIIIIINLTMQYFLGAPRNLDNIVVISITTISSVDIVKVQTDTVTSLHSQITYKVNGEKRTNANLSSLVPGHMIPRE